MKKVIDIKSLIIGVLVTALVFTIIGARGKNSANFDTITAKTIRIVNQKGEVAAILTSSLKGYGLEIRNGKGKIIADLINLAFLTALTLYSEEKPACQLVSVFLGELGLYGGLYLLNQHGKEVVRLRSTSGGGELVITNQHGKKVVTLASKAGGALFIANQHGKEVVALGSYNLCGILFILNQHGKDAVRLEPTKDGGALVIYNQHGKTVATLQSTERGSGGLYLYNQHGKHIVILGSDTYGNGAIFLGDRYGDLGWGKIGKK